MQFTPQQLAGGIRFSPVTRIGNWQEELALEEAKVSNFHNQSTGGKLSLRKLENKISKCNQLVPHSYAADGIIRFGDSVILCHDSSSGVLGCDPFEEIIVGEGKYYVSTIAEDPMPKARNTFRVVRPPKHFCNYNDHPSDPVLQIGQSFLLACDDALLVSEGSSLLAPTLYLSSTKKNERMATKRTNRQLVYMTSKIDSEAIWTAIVPSHGRQNAGERLLAMGQPVSVTHALQITHRQTNMYLTCDPAEKTTTEFGLEMECFADRSAATGKLSLIMSEFKGSSTTQTLAKPDAPIFAWHFVLSDDPRAAEDKRSLPLRATAPVILQQMRDSIKSRGVDAFWNLREYFKQFEKKTLSTGKLDRDDLKTCLLEWGIGISADYLDQVLDMCDKGSLGLIDVRDFMEVARGPLSEPRLSAMRVAFEALDKRGDGFVTLKDMERYFSGADHPMVAIGGYSEAEALEHLISSFGIGTTTGSSRGLKQMPQKVNFQRFCDYYGDLSGAIDDDMYFDTIVSSNWAAAITDAPLSARDSRK